jgi:plasmid stabilization system protein ParE
MEKGIPCKPAILSKEFKTSRANIYDYGRKEFGVLQAERYDIKIAKSLSSLHYSYTRHAECSQMRTASRMYRRIKLGSYLIIYRIAATRIEVLDIIHSKSGSGRYRAVRSIRL